MRLIYFPMMTPFLIILCKQHLPPTHTHTRTHTHVYIYIRENVNIIKINNKHILHPNQPPQMVSLRIFLIEKRKKNKTKCSLLIHIKTYHALSPPSFVLFFFFSSIENTIAHVWCYSWSSSFLWTRFTFWYPPIPPQHLSLSLSLPYQMGYVALLNVISHHEPSLFAYGLSFPLYSLSFYVL